MTDCNPKKMSLDEYLSSKDLRSPISDFLLDKLRSNRQLKTARGRKRFEDECEKHRIEYAEKRDAAIKEYYELAEQGKIVPKTTLEKTIEKAIYGHPDNPSTQAARRVCEKRGINWRNYHE